MKVVKVSEGVNEFGRLVLVYEASGYEAAVSVVSKVSKQTKLRCFV